MSFVKYSIVQEIAKSDRIPCLRLSGGRNMNLRLLLKAAYYSYPALQQVFIILRACVPVGYHVHAFKGAWYGTRLGYMFLYSHS